MIVMAVEEQYTHSRPGGCIFWFGPATFFSLASQGDLLMTHSISTCRVSWHLHLKEPQGAVSVLSLVSPSGCRYGRFAKSLPSIQTHCSVPIWNSYVFCGLRTIAPLSSLLQQRAFVALFVTQRRPSLLKWHLTGQESVSCLLRTMTLHICSCVRTCNLLPAALMCVASPALESFVECVVCAHPACLALGPLYVSSYFENEILSLPLAPISSALFKARRDFSKLATSVKTPCAAARLCRNAGTPV